MHNAKNTKMVNKWCQRPDPVSHPLPQGVGGQHGRQDRSRACQGGRENLRSVQGGQVSLRFNWAGRK